MPNSPATISACTTFAAATAPERKIPSGTSGCATRAWRTTNAARSAAATAPRISVCAEPHAPKDQRLRGAPAVLGRADDRVDAEHQRADDQDRAGHVRAAVQADARVTVEQARGDEGRADADRQVDEEDPVPVDRLGQHAAGQQADRRAGRRDEAVD